MTSTVKKTGYKAPKVKRSNDVKVSKNHYVKRSLSDFPPPPRMALEGREIGATIKLIKTIYRNQWGAISEFGGESEFPIAIPGEYGSYRGQRTVFENRKNGEVRKPYSGVGQTYQQPGLVPVTLCEIKLLYVGVLLPDNGEWFEWI